jgi:NhaP-type Na+/H+ or K+/H+ antiporter/Trk K+ transport system NAD-binding subunit
LLQTVVLVLLLGVIGLAAADALRVPSIAPLLLFGVIAGPSALGLIDPASFGDGLAVFIKLGVAIIIFEGAMTLSVKHLVEHYKVVRNLVSLGLLITLTLGTLAFMLLLGSDPLTALVFGSLITITGPTVVQPLLKRVPVTESVSHILQSEAVLLEPAGVLIAALIFEVVVASSPSAGDAVTFFLKSVAVGALVGLALGWALRIGLTRVALREEVRNLTVLAVLLGGFALAEGVSPDSGIMTAVVGGLMLSGTEFAGKASLKQFKGQITLLTVASIFILISASISVEEVARIGWAGAGIVALLVLIVRPLSVFACTAGSELKFNERVFLSGVAPRGIVAGSVASLISLRLAGHGFPQAQDVMTVVFMTIGATVLVLAPMTQAYAAATGVFIDRRKSVLFVGANAFTRAIAARMRDAGYRAAFVDTNFYNCFTTRDEFEHTVHGSALDEETMLDAGAAAAGTLVASTMNNETNILISQFALREFKIPVRAVVLQLSTDDSVAKHVKESDLKVAMGGRFELNEWIHMVEHGETTFVRFTTEKDVASIEPLTDRIRGFALPAFYEEGETLRLLFRSSRLPAGTTIHFMVKRDELGKLEEQFKEYCASLVK